MSDHRRYSPAPFNFGPGFVKWRGSDPDPTRQELIEELVTHGHTQSDAELLVDKAPSGSIHEPVQVASARVHIAMQNLGLELDKAFGFSRLLAWAVRKNRR